MLLYPISKADNEAALAVSQKFVSSADSLAKKTIKIHHLLILNINDNEEKVKETNTSKIASFLVSFIIHFFV
jgi:hypothetical protein